MPLQNTTDLMYITNRCPKIFVLYVLNCTVSKPHCGVSSLFSSRKLLLLRQTPESKKRKKKRKTRQKQENKYMKSVIRGNTKNVGSV